jgi:3-oxoacyl-[acyl-carrier protein] reductase
MDLGLGDKVAAVMAASDGLGLACARALAREGARVAICARDEQRLARAVNELERLGGGQVRAAAVDVRQHQAIDAWLGATRERWGRVDVLVTNAGGPPPALASDLEVQALRSAMELGFESALEAITCVLPWMRAQRFGRIVALTSSSVRAPIPGLVLSNAVRAGLTGYLKTLAGEVAADGITVNSINTGSFATERLEELFQARARASGRSVEEERLAVRREIPAGRFGSPEELGALVAFLASRQAAYLTGAALPLDGGAGRALL